MNGDTIIEVEDLHIIFDERHIVRGFSMFVKRGEKVLLMGPSGSGKSTILQCLAGFIKPQRGRIEIDGKILTSESVWAVRQRIVWVAQEPDLGRGTVKEILERPFHYKANIHHRENLARIPELMQRFHLPSLLLDKEISTLSGGEKQRVALVAALLLDRPVLLLDEISSALDAESKRTVMEFLRQAHDLTIVMVSHDREWADCFDRVVNLTPEDTQHE